MSGEDRKALIEWITKTENFLNTLEDMYQRTDTITNSDIETAAGLFHRGITLWFPEKEPRYNEVIGSIQGKLVKNISLEKSDYDKILTYGREILVYIVRKHHIVMKAGEPEIITLSMCCTLLQQVRSPVTSIQEQIDDIEKNVLDPPSPEATNTTPQINMSWFEIPRRLRRDSEEVKGIIAEITPQVVPALKDLYQRYEHIKKSTHNTVLKQTGDIEHLFRDLHHTLRRDMNLSFMEANKVVKSIRNIKNHLYRKIEGLAGGSWELFGRDWDNLRNGIQGLGNAIVNIFTFFRNTFNNIIRGLNTSIQRLINWVMPGFHRIVEGIQGFASRVVDGIRHIYQWFLNGFNILWNALLRLLNDLFKITEAKLSQYGLWQARVQYNLEKTICNTF